MTRHALLAVLLFTTAPALAQPAGTGADSATQAGSLVGAAVSVAMGAQSRIAMLDHDGAVVPAVYRHHLPRHRSAAKATGTPHSFGVTFSADVSPDAPADATRAAAAPGVTPQDLAAALSTR